VEPRLSGARDAVIAAVEAEAHEPPWTTTPRQVVQRTVGDDQRHRPSRRADASRARGWPIGPGVVEGACGHLVNDRLEPSGRRWTRAGAQVGRALRAVRLNGPWEASWPFHRRPPHERFYGRSAPAPAWANARALEWAA